MLEINGSKAFAYTGGKAFDAKLPTVVLVHGAQNDHSVWALQSRYLAHHGYGVLAVDLPGHGRSAGAALGSVEAIADWIVALLDTAGVARASLVGHSMGALVALDCAGRHSGRVAGIAMIGVAYPMKVSDELLDATKNREPEAQAMVNLWLHASLAPYPANPGPGFWVMGGNARLMQRQKPGVMHTGFAACNAYAGGTDAAAKVNCPVLFLLARRDMMTSIRSAQALANLIKGSKTVIVEDCGHNLMGEKPDETLDALIAFLKSAAQP